MALNTLMQTGEFQYVILPVLIFLLRICDVTLGTLRIVYVSRGEKILSVAFAFFEILIWLFAVGQILQNLNHPANYIAFATGYAAGNYVGIWVENKLSLGILMLRIFTCRGSDVLARYLRDAGFGVTRVSAYGTEGPAEVLLAVIRRQDCRQAMDLVRQHAPDAFYTTEEIKSVNHAPFSLNEQQPITISGKGLMFFRKQFAAR